MPELKSGFTQGSPQKKCCRIFCKARIVADFRVGVASSWRSCNSFCHSKPCGPAPGSLCLLSLHDRLTEPWLAPQACRYLCTPQIYLGRSVYMMLLIKRVFSRKPVLCAPTPKTRKMTAKNATSSAEKDCQNCNMRLFIGTDLVECLMEAIHCQWAMGYGYSRILCKNPSAKRFVNPPHTDVLAPMILKQADF